MLAFFLTLIDDENDRRYFESVYNSYRQQMMNVALGVLKSVYDAEDVVHDVFFQMADKYLDSIKAIDGEQDLKNYLLKAVKNMALNKKRDDKLHREIEQREEAAHEGDFISDDDLMELLCSKESYEEVLAAIKALDPKYSDILYLHFVLEMNMPEVADYLGKNINTVRKQLARGKLILAELVGDRRGVTIDDEE